MEHDVGLRIRRIVGEKRADKRRMDGLREEVGVRGSYKMKEWEMKNWLREQMPRKWREKRDEKDQGCDGRTGLREIWEEWEEKGEQQQDIEGGDW